MGGSSQNDSVAVFWCPIYSQVSALKTSYTIKSFAMRAKQHPREGSSQSQSQETPSIPHRRPIRLLPLSLTLPDNCIEISLTV